MGDVGSFFVGRSIYNPLTASTSTSSSTTATWTREQEKLFETGLVIYPEGTPDRWVRIAERVPGKNQFEVFQHYKVLVDDITEIEAGNVELPNYLDVDDDDPEPTTKTERKKGIPWTGEEHRNFLEGLRKYSKGDWRSISRFCVVSRTPTQVASHAQKYFQHQGTKKHKKPRKRPSIHDTPPSVVEEANNTTNCLNAHAPVMMHPNQQSSMQKMDDPYLRGQGGSFPNIHDTPFVVAEDNNKNYLNAAGVVAHTPAMMHRKNQGGSFPNIGGS
ncbi:hypothetical protein MKW92_021882 [Papaver armeniacum]|nr:hypothetical protein MKW92_021882 [Papaver armeniacum]